MAQGGSFEIGSQIFPDFVQVQTEPNQYWAIPDQVSENNILTHEFVPPLCNMQAKRAV